MKRDSFFLGCLLGSFAPMAAYFLKTFTLLGTTLHPLSLYVIAGGVNMLLIRLLFRRSLEQNARGVLMITFVAVLLLIFIEKLSLT